MDELKIFRFLETAGKTGVKSALVSVVATDGPSMRLPGAHMAVAKNGDHVGSVSGGCIEQAVIAEALAAIGDRTARLTRFGTGSKYIDIRLPCGGAMDLHFQPWHEAALTAKLLDAIIARRPFTLGLGLGDTTPRFIPERLPTQWDEEVAIGRVGHWPRPRLLVLGQGENAARLVEMGSLWGAEVALHSPDRQLVAELSNRGYGAQLLRQPSDLGEIALDPWTAIALLFHEHDWEVPAIEALLEQPHFYFGAMGSRQTHQRRVDDLRQRGFSNEQLANICAPIGLIPGSRDPATLAISILSEVVDHHRRADFANNTPGL